MQSPVFRQVLTESASCSVARCTADPVCSTRTSAGATGSCCDWATGSRACGWVRRRRRGRPWRSCFDKGSCRTNRTQENYLCGSVGVASRTHCPLPPNFQHILSFGALRSCVPNKILLFAWSQNIWPPQKFGQATVLVRSAIYYDVTLSHKSLSRPDSVAAKS